MICSMNTLSYTSQFYWSLYQSRLYQCECPIIITACKRIWGKVMFLNLSVSHSVHGWGGGGDERLCVSRVWGLCPGGVHPGGVHVQGGVIDPPRTQRQTPTEPKGKHPQPRGRHPLHPWTQRQNPPPDPEADPSLDPEADTPLDPEVDTTPLPVEAATEAGGTHPTGMHSLLMLGIHII